MKSLLLLCALAPLIATAQSDVDQLKHLNESWIHSYLTRDTATLSRIWADDIILINPEGKSRTKQEMLKGVVGQQILSSKVDTVSVRLLGDKVGLVTATASFTFDSGGNTMKGRTEYLDVYEKRNGRWVAVAAHVTSLQ